jgi:hypothetical protein
MPSGVLWCTFECFGELEIPFADYIAQMSLGGEHQGRTRHQDLKNVPSISLSLFFLFFFLFFFPG